MSTVHKIVPHDEWITARRRLLVKEKEFTHRRGEMSREQRELPWEAVDKQYLFDGQDGRETLPQLFAGRHQLIVYHFMFGPDWEAGCPHCSFWADHFNPAIAHLNQRDVTMVAVSRAPYEKLEAYERRMGWSFKWVSSANSDFNFDFQASFRPEELAAKDAFYNFTRQDPGSSEREGISVFFKGDDGRVYHTYSTYARGIDAANTAYQLLDLVPKGRDEGGRSQFWVRRHDEYAIGAPADKQFTAIASARHANTFHQIAINASPDKVYAAVATQQGLASWWTADTTADEKVGGKAEFGFDNRGVVFRMKIDELVPGKRVVWSCNGDQPEWNGTTLTWTMTPDKGGTILRFNQRWRAQTDWVATCNSTWGELMYRLKDSVEGRNPGPHWTK